MSFEVLIKQYRAYEQLLLDMIDGPTKYPSCIESCNNVLAFVIPEDLLDSIGIYMWKDIPDIVKSKIISVTFKIPIRKKPLKDCIDAATPLCEIWGFKGRLSFLEEFETTTWRDIRNNSENPEQQLPDDSHKQWWSYMDFTPNAGAPLEAIFVKSVDELIKPLLTKIQNELDEFAETFDKSKAPFPEKWRSVPLFKDIMSIDQLHDYHDSIGMKTKKLKGCIRSWFHSKIKELELAFMNFHKQHKADDSHTFILEEIFASPRFPLYLTVAQIEKNFYITRNTILRWDKLAAKGKHNTNDYGCKWEGPIKKGTRDKNLYDSKMVFMYFDTECKQNYKVSKYSDLNKIFDTNNADGEPYGKGEGVTHHKNPSGGNIHR